MVTVLVNTVRVRVLTEDGQTLPVQLSAQWSSASQMSAEVFEVRYSLGTAGFLTVMLAYHFSGLFQPQYCCVQHSDNNI